MDASVKAQFDDLTSQLEDQKTQSEKVLGEIKTLVQTVADNQTATQAAVEAAVEAANAANVAEVSAALAAVKTAADQTTASIQLLDDQVPDAVA